MSATSSTTTGRHVRALRLRPATWPRWVALCAASEMVGMTAAATAATIGNHAIGQPHGVAEVAAVVALAVAGGAVEGVAVAYAMWTGLGAQGTGLTLRRWTVATTVAAMLGWAMGTVPSAVRGSADDSSQPPWGLVVAGALVVGVAMGALLGLVQARVLRGHVRHPGRWVRASCLGWAPAMAVIFVGASLPDSSWPPLAVVVTGTVTGVVAGAVLGAVTGLWLRSLDGLSLADRSVLRVLASPAHEMLSGALAGLRVCGRRTGQVVELPVQYALVGSESDALVLVVGGDADRKSWWRNVIEPRPVDVLVDGAWRPGTASVVLPGQPDYAESVAAYRRRWPKATITAATPVVRVQPAAERVDAAR